MAEGQVFDVFLSHHSADKPAVELLARRLEDDAGLHPFLDKWHLTPGSPWQEELERALDHSRTCAVFIGPSGIGSWENEEMRSALDGRVKRPEFRVVPVLLPGATMPERGVLPRFLSRLTWVDFRRPDGVQDAEAFRRLVAGIRGIAPGRDDTGVPTASTFICPYRGLEVFDEAHAALFFGREAVTQHLVEAMRGTRFLAVVGPSGSGKSSVVRAGLLPALRTGALPSSDRWRYLVCKPGAHPLQELAVQLVHGDKTDSASERMLPVLHSLEADERALHLQVRLSLAEQRSDGRCCLVVDQFEEVFTLCPYEAERLRFIELLRYAATIGGGQTVIIVTLRADFVARAATYTPLAELLSAHQFLLSPMDEEDLRRTIEEPARQAGLRWEAGLVEAILQDTGREPGALPLMEHALLQLWERRRAGNVMTLQAYVEIGRVQGALAKRAEEVFAALPPEQQWLARPILLRLTQPGEGTEDTRRRAAMSELLTHAGEREAVEGVVGALTDARLLTTSGEGPAGEQAVDVSHEALIRGWPRLRRWIDDDRAGLRVHRRLTEAAQEWQRLHRDASVLYRGVRLAEAVEWRARNEGALNALERDFLEASVRRRRLTWAAVALAGVLLLSAIFAWQQRYNALKALKDSELREAFALEGVTVQSNADGSKSLIFSTSAKGGAWKRLLPKLSQLSPINSLVLAADNDLDRLDLPQQLSTLQRLHVTDNINLKHVNFLAELSVLAELRVSDNPALGTLILPNKFNNLSILGVLNNPALGILDLPESLPRLRSLQVQNNKVLETIRIPQSLPELEVLYIRNNPKLEALQVPSNLNALKRIEVLDNSNLAVLNLFQSLPKLDQLYVRNNSKLALLELQNGLDKLRELDISNNEMLSALYLSSPMEQLRSLIINGNRQLMNFTEWRKVPNLEVAALAGPLLVNLEAVELAGLPNLRALLLPDDNKIALKLTEELTEIRKARGLLPVQIHYTYPHISDWENKLREISSSSVPPIEVMEKCRGIDTKTKTIDIRSKHLQVANDRTAKITVEYTVEVGFKPCESGDVRPIDDRTCTYYPAEMRLIRSTTIEINGNDSNLDKKVIDLPYTKPIYYKGDCNEALETSSFIKAHDNAIGGGDSWRKYIDRDQQELLKELSVIGAQSGH